MRTRHAITTCSLSLAFFSLAWTCADLQSARRQPRTRLLSGGVRRRQWVWAKEGKKGIVRAVVEKNRVCATPMRRQPARLEYGSILTQSRAIRHRAADRARHVGPPARRWKLANAHLRLWNSITSGHTRKAVQKPFTRWLQSRSLSEHGPQDVLCRRMMRLPPFKRAAASLLSIHCCCCCHLSRLVWFLFSSGCLLSSLSHRHVKAVCVSKTGGTEEWSCSAALLASTAQASV